MQSLFHLAQCEALFAGLAAETHCDASLLREFLSRPPTELRVEKYVAVFLRDLCLIAAPPRWPLLELVFSCLDSSSEQLVPVLQREAMSMPSTLLLEFLREKGLYKPHFNVNVNELIGGVENALAFELLMFDEGYLHSIDLETQSKWGKTPLECVASQCWLFMRPVNRFTLAAFSKLFALMIKAGANLDVVLRDQYSLSSDALAVLLSLQPGEALAKKGLWRLIIETVPREAAGGEYFVTYAACRLFSVFHQFREELVDDVLNFIADYDGDIQWRMTGLACALHMFGLVDVLPERVLEMVVALRDGRLEQSMFLWSPKWHKYHPKPRRDRIFCVLLCLRKGVPLPRLVHKILFLMVCLEMFAENAEHLLSLGIEAEVFK